MVDRSHLPLAALVAAGLSVAFAMSGLATGELWPSSDLDGHVAAVETFRQGLNEGVLWPYDRRSGGGCDALAFYSWPAELAMAALAEVITRCGAGHGARWVVMGMLVAGIAALPLSAAACARRLAVEDPTWPPGQRSRAGRDAAHAGALAAWVFLATHTSDGISGYGMDAVALGLVAQILGWNVLLWLAGRAAVPTAGGWDALLSIGIALALLVHSLTALAAVAVLGCAAVTSPRRMIIASAVGGVAAAMSLGALAHVHGELLGERAWIGVLGEDPLLAWGDRAWFATGWRQALPDAALLGGMLGVLGAVSALRRGTPARVLVAAALVLIVLATLPAARLGLPAGAQLDRLQAPAWLLVLVAGAASAPRLRNALAGRAPWWLVGAGVAALWVGTGCDQCRSWHRDPARESPAALLVELRAQLPAGSRVLAADQPGWHRWALAEWASACDWESLGCLQTVVAPPLHTGIEPAARRLGLRLCGVAPPAEPPLSSTEAERMLEDAGIDHLLRRRLPEDGPDRAVTACSWARSQSADWTIWSAAAPRPRIAACLEGVAGLDLVDAARWRRTVALWAARRRAQQPHLPRLALLEPGQPAPLLRGGDGRLMPIMRAAVDLSGCSDRVLEAIQRLRGAAAGGGSQALAGALLSAACDGLGAVGAIASLPPGPAPQLRWLGTNRLEIASLLPGRPYLLRYAYSGDLHSADGRILAEASGMTLLIPQASTMHIACSPMTGWVQAGCLTTAVMAVALTIMAWRQRRRRG